jgi:hypothetical protein
VTVYYRPDKLGPQEKYITAKCTASAEIDITIKANVVLLPKFDYLGLGL